jgi:hypothetical protein
MFYKINSHFKQAALAMALLVISIAGAGHVRIKRHKIFIRQTFFASQMTFFVYFYEKKIYENRIGKMYEWRMV